MQYNHIDVELQKLDHKLSHASYQHAMDEIRQSNKLCKKQGVLVCESDPYAFIGYVLACVYSEVPVFLANPNWRQSEWEQVFDQISPALVFGNAPTFPINPGVESRDLKLFKGYIMVPTGGTSGNIRFAMHTWGVLENSACATAMFLKKDKINSLCLLPLYHISGLMQIVRTTYTKGTILFDPLESFNQKHNFKGYCLSLVPTQLERFMQNPGHVALLKTFDTVFLGGAPATNHLLTKAREAGIRLSPTYGMTETASMVTAMDPEDFLNGRTGVGLPLGHAKIFTDENGLISIRAHSLFSGYFPARPIIKNLWETNDEGTIDNEGYLSITGRADHIIITGGEKVDPKEVENAIHTTGLVSSVMVVGISDSEWGQRIVSIYVPAIKGDECSLKIKEQIKATLANYKIPKDWIMVDELPIDEKGKVINTAIEKLIEDAVLVS